MPSPFVEAIGAGIIVSLWNRFLLPWALTCVEAMVEEHEDPSPESSACSGEIFHH